MAPAILPESLSLLLETPLPLEETLTSCPVPADVLHFSLRSSKGKTVSFSRCLRFCLNIGSLRRRRYIQQCLFVCSLTSRRVPLIRCLGPQSHGFFVRSEASKGTCLGRVSLDSRSLAISGSPTGSGHGSFERLETVLHYNAQSWSPTEAFFEDWIARTQASSRLC